jgi:hypothetical protein
MNGEWLVNERTSQEKETSGCITSKSPATQTASG